MNETLNYYILRKIFKYFNVMELRNVATVCKLWSIIVEDEKMSRGPLIIVTSLEGTETMGNWHEKIGETLNTLRIKPRLKLQINENLPCKHFIYGCTCSYLPSDCYSLCLTNNFVRNDCRRTINIILPEVSTLKITVRTFIELYQSKVIYCAETKIQLDSMYFKYDCIHQDFFYIFSGNIEVPRCIIFFAQYDSMELVQAFLDYLLTWFSYLAINVWGGIVDELLVCCNFVNDISLCCGNSKYLFIFISGHDMETFMLNYAEDCDDKVKIETKLANFRSNIQLKRHAICFMYTTYRRAREFIHVELEIFEKYFPKVPYSYIIGCAGFGKDLKVTYETLKNTQRKIQRLETKLMILTYN